MRYVFLALFLAGSSLVQAQVTVSAVTDAASFIGRVAPGSLATVFGTDLSTTTASATFVPLPTLLGGSQVLVNGSAVPLIYVSPGQINFQVPSGVPLGSPTIVVTSNGQASPAITFTVNATGPGIFEDSSGQAIAQNATDFSLNTPSNPVLSGDTIVLYVDGLGAVTNPVADGAATPGSPLSTSVADVTATVGGYLVPVFFAGLTPGFVGLAQVNIQIPDYVPAGNFPLVITAGGLLAYSANVSVSGTTAAPIFLQPTAYVGNFAISPRNNFWASGSTLYFCGAERIRVFDISTPSQPNFLNAYGVDDLNNDGQNCAINTSGGTPFLVDISGTLNPYFAIYSLSDPQVPALIATATPTYTNLVDLSFSGTVGFSNTNWFEYDTSFNVAAQHGDILAFDFSNPAAPGFISALQPDSSQPATGNLSLKPFSALASSTVLYVASTTATGSDTNGLGALDVINVSNPAVMQGITQVAVPNTAILTGFGISGSTLLALGNTASVRNPGVPDFNYLGDLTLTTMNVSNIGSPSLIATVDTGIQVTGAERVANLGSGIFAISYLPPETDYFGPSTLAVVDARDPTNPVLYPYATGYSIDGMVAFNGYLYLSNFGSIAAYQIIQQQ